MTTYAIVGTRTTTQHGAEPGPGLAVYEVDGATWTERNRYEVDNAGYVAAHGDLVAAVHNGDGAVSTFRFSDGELTHLGTRDVEPGPVYVTFSPSGRHILTANYGSGTISILPVGEDGSPGEATSHRMTGEPGQHKDDQDGSHPHQIILTPDGSQAVVVDKGLDTLFVFDLDDATGELTPSHEKRLRQMNGPRHIGFSPDGGLVYLANELSNTAAVLNASDLEPIQYRTTIEDTDVRETRAGGVVVDPDGRFVIVSNRTGAGDPTPPGPGTDTLASFPVGEKGMLEPARIVDTGYLRPRFITLDPDGALVVAQDQSSVIQRFPLVDGVPDAPVEVAHVGSPMCVIFLES